MSTESVPSAPEPPAPMTPERARAIANASRPRIDAYPSDSILARMTTDERAVVYMASIRRMMIFFVVLAALGIIAEVIIGVIDINAVHQAQQTGVGVGFGS